MKVKVFNLRDKKGETILSSARETLVLSRKAELEGRGVIGLEIVPSYVEAKQ